MITPEQYQRAVGQASAMLQNAGLVITPEEQNRFEVADFGLGSWRRPGCKSSPTSIPNAAVRRKLS